MKPRIERVEIAHTQSASCLEQVGLSSLVYVLPEYPNLLPNFAWGSDLSDSAIVGFRWRQPASFNLGSRFVVNVPILYRICCL